MPTPVGTPPRILSHTTISQLTGSASGSASPSTRYGSFPPTSTPVMSGDEINQRLSHASTSREVMTDDNRSRTMLEFEENAAGVIRSDRKGKGKKKSKGSERRWTRSSETLLRGDVEDIYDQDDDIQTRLTPEDEEELMAGRKLRRTLSQSRSEILESKGLVGTTEIQYGVLKMELIARNWGKRGLWSIYAGVYLISTFTSLESNTTPTIEPYFLSLLNSHTFLSGMSIAVSIAYAVGAAPMSKILDVFGRAEGVLLSAIIYFLGFMLTASAQNAEVFVIARSMSAFAGQGLQLAQQIIIADTTTLANRGLITSTISLPWLVTTSIGPPLGAWCQSKGEVGYRAIYFVFAIFTPLASLVLVVSLAMEWRMIKLKYASQLSDRERGEEVGVRWIDKSNSESALVVKSFRASAARVWTDLDVVGLCTLTVGCSLVLLPLSLAAITSAEHAWTSLLIIIGVVVIAYFIYYEAKISTLPMLPTRLISNRTIISGSILGFFHYASQYIYGSFFTSFLQLARNYSPRDASYISQSYLFSASVSAILAGFLTKYTRRYKWVGIVGVLVHFSGIALMLRARRVESSNFELLASQVIAGLGGGFTTIAAQIGVQSVVSPQDVAVATAIFLLITQIGGACGGAVAGSIWSNFLPARLQLYLPQPVSPHLVDKIMASLPYAMSFPLDSPTRIAIELAYKDVQTLLVICSLAMLAPTLMAVCWMKNTNLESEDQGMGKGINVVLGRASAVESAGESSSGSSCSETSSLLDR